jgi:hypothetical protein
MFEKKILGIVLGGLLMGGNYCNGQFVKITVDGNTVTYNSLKSLKEIKGFTMALQDAREEGIEIEGSESICKVDEAVKAVLANTRENLPPGFQMNNTKGKAFLVMFLWVMQKWLYSCNIDSSIYCLTELHGIASTAFEKARLLIFSQCNPDGITPLPTADWNIIGDAVLMLKKEKNGHSNEAKALLGQLKTTGQYNALLGKWHDDTQEDGQ